MESPRRERRASATWILVTLLLAVGCAILLWAPWRGPVVLSLSESHGIHAGDLLGLILVGLAVAIALGCGPRLGRTV